MRVQELRRPAPIESNPLTLASRPVPSPGPGEVLLRIVATGVCHTDLHIAEGELPPRRDVVVPGHQVVGLVEQVGPGGDLVQGQRVGGTWLFRSCGPCDARRRGEGTLRPQPRGPRGGAGEWGAGTARAPRPRAPRPLDRQMRFPPVGVFIPKALAAL